MKIWVLFGAFTSLSACASATNGAKQRVMVSAPGAVNAKCSLISPSLGVQYFTTPEAIEISRSSEEIQIHCQKKCFKDSVSRYKPVINSEDLASNVFLGGVVPLAIDMTTKKYYSYNHEINIEMSRDGRCQKELKGFLDGEPKDYDNRIKDFSFDSSDEPIVNKIGQVMPYGDQSRASKGRIK